MLLLRLLLHDGGVYFAFAPAPAPAFSHYIIIIIIIIIFLYNFIIIWDSVQQNRACGVIIINHY